MNEENFDVIYWSPYYLDDQHDWSILYNGKLKTLHDELIEEISHEEIPGNNMFYCPAVKDLTSKTIVLKNGMRSEFTVDVENKNLIAHGKSWIQSSVNRLSSIKNRTHIEYGMGWIFFSESDIEMTLTSPYFNAPNHMNYGTIAPGKFNISKWFRKINIEFILNKNCNRLVIEKDEPLAFCNFNTKKKIILKRFLLTDLLIKYSRTCNKSSNWEPWVSLDERYDRFTQSDFNKLVSKEIRNNLVE